MKKISRVLLLILDIPFRVVGIVLGLINLLGYVWFSSTLPLALMMPPVVIFAVILVPLKVLARERWLLIVLAILYIASYVLGGFNFALTNEKFAILGLQETIIIVYFFARAIFMVPDCESMGSAPTDSKP